ncbi:FGGY-family carbohydrate kinase [Candidatus Hodarchaeum mangrovi]
MNVYYLSLDAGTSGGKAVIIDEIGKIKGFSKIPWSQHYLIPEGLEPYGHEFNPDLFWNILVKCIQQALENASVESREIKAISATSQRHGCVFLNKEGKEIYAGPNRDARGLEVDVEEYMTNEELFRITGHGAPFLFALPRLLWFKENEEEKYNMIKHLLTIDGWVNYRLTGKYTSDDTAAAETLLFDITARKWSDKIMEEFNFSHEILPELLQFGEVIGSINPEISQQLGFSSQIPVIMSAADTQASLIGCGAIHPNSMGVVAGSTMPLQFVVQKPLIDPDQNIWTGAFPLHRWVIESNAGSGGDIHHWFIESILSPLEVHNPWEKFEQLVLSEAPGSGGVFADLGPQIFSAQKMLLIPSGGGYQFTPIAYSFDNPINIGSFARALLENLSYAVRANYEQISDLTGVPSSEINLVGGLSRSKAFAQILSNVLNSEIRVLEPEGAALAGAIASMIGLGVYKDMEEACKFFREHIYFYPQEAENAEYESLYPRWKEIYQESRTEE